MLSTCGPLLSPSSFIKSSRPLKPIHSYIHLLLTLTPCFLFFTFPAISNTDKGEEGRRQMASEAPSWADQWGAGGFGAMEEDGSTAKPDAGSNKKATKTGALAKAKSAASTGAMKIKLGVSKGMKWIKQKCQKKSAKTSDNNTV